MKSDNSMVSQWRITPHYLYYVMLLPPPDDENPLGEYSLKATKTVSSGPWSVFSPADRPGAALYIYRRRAIVRFDLREHRFVSADDAIRWSVKPAVKSEALSLLTENLTAPLAADGIKSIPILIAGLDTSRDATSDIIGDGVTSFHFRLYDASASAQAIVRVSRHLVMVAGAGGRVVQEVVNLAYEKLLYDSSPTISTDAVFAFLDGLARYTIPTENSVFLQREFARLALFLATVQVIVGVWAVIATQWSQPFIYSAFGMLALIVASYVTVRRLKLVHWR